jgi:hypothetical protein
MPTVIELSSWSEFEKIEKEYLYNQTNENMIVAPTFIGDNLTRPGP